MVLVCRQWSPRALTCAPACAQANELELALDVYGQLLREGCTPNLVTYNILIDVHGKMGNWQEAGQVLDALESQVRPAAGDPPAQRLRPSHLPS